MRKKRARLALMAAVAVLVAGGAIIAHERGLLRWLELQSIDARFGVRGTQPKPKGVAVVAIDTTTFNDIARHLYGVSEGLLDGMRKVVTLNPDLPERDQQRMRAEWLQAVEAFVRVNHEVLTLAELLRALLAANDVASEPKAALS